MPPGNQYQTPISIKSLVITKVLGFGIISTNVWADISIGSLKTSAEKQFSNPLL